MNNPYISSIYIFGGNFAINGFALCAGQFLAISSNTALFSLIGTYYGGNGTSTFGLPDLRGRTAVSQGQGPGTSPYELGEATGTENTTLLYSNMPQHNHLVNATTASGSTALPSANFFGDAKQGSSPRAPAELFYNTSAVNVPLNQSSIGFTGGNIPFAVQQPGLVLTTMIALRGIFPSRN
jgi:microcystin-dependent protein